MGVSSTDVEGRIRECIAVEHLEIKHEPSGCGDKYSVIIVSQVFEGKTTLSRHRMVNDLLSNQIAQMHAFSQKLFTPKEYNAYVSRQANETTK